MFSELMHSLLQTLRGEETGPERVICPEPHGQEQKQSLQAVQPHLPQLGHTTAGAISGQELRRQQGGARHKQAVLLCFLELCPSGHV